MAEMTPADVHAMLEGAGNDGFGNGWWLILLFLFMGNGWNWNRNNGDYGQFATAASQQEILFGQKFGDLDNKIDRLGNGIADATFALNNTINNAQTVLGGAINGEGRALQSQLAQCCCDNKMAIANLSAKTDQQTCAITTAIHAEGEATRNLIQQNELQTLRDKVASLEMDNRMCGVVRYPNSWTYSANNPFCNYNGNSGCGCNNI